MLGCQFESGSEVLVSTVGYFGVSSACSHWSWLASSTGRLTQYLTGRHATSWLMLLADDFHLEVGDVHFRPAFLIFLLCSVVGSWKKKTRFVSQGAQGLLVRQVGKTDSWLEVRPREIV